MVKYWSNINHFQLCSHSRRRPKSPAGDSNALVSLTLSERTRRRKSEEGRGGCRKRCWQLLRQQLHVSEMCGRHCTVGAVRYVPADHCLWLQRGTSGFVKNHGIHHDVVFALTFSVSHLDCCASTAKMLDCDARNRYASATLATKTCPIILIMFYFGRSSRVALRYCPMWVSCSWESLLSLS